MTTTLSEMHAMVADALGRSTSLDSVIPKRVEMAANWLERTYTFQYMRTWRELLVDPAAQYPYILSLYDMRVKGIDSLRIRSVGSDGSVRFSPPLRKVKPTDRESRPTGSPESYWLNGVSSIILNSTPDEALTLEANLVQFTRWGSADNWTHWLLDNATQLLLVKTLMSMSIRIRDPELYTMYETELKAELQSFNVSEEEFVTGDFVQVWEPPYVTELDESLRSQ